MMAHAKNFLRYSTKSILFVAGLIALVLTVIVVPRFQEQAASDEIASWKCYDWISTEDPDWIDRFLGCDGRVVHLSLRGEGDSQLDMRQVSVFGRLKSLRSVEFADLSLPAMMTIADGLETCRFEGVDGNISKLLRRQSSLRSLRVERSGPFGDYELAELLRKNLAITELELYATNVEFERSDVASTSLTSIELLGRPFECEKLSLLIESFPSLEEAIVRIGLIDDECSCTLLRMPIDLSLYIVASESQLSGAALVDLRAHFQSILIEEEVEY